MTLVRWLLAGVILVELAGAAFLANRSRNRPTAPIPDLGESDPVTADAIRALAANCRTPGDWAALGETYLATGFFAEGEACLRRAVEMDPDHVEHRFKHAFALERLGLVEEAIAEFEQAAARNHPRAADCWYYIGRNRLRLEQSARAAEAFERAGNLPGARYELALLSARAGRASEADVEAAKLAAEFPDSHPPVSLRYRLAMARDDRALSASFADQFALRSRQIPNPFATEVQWIFGIADGFGRAGLFRDAGREVQAGRIAVAESRLRDALSARWEPEVADRLAEVAFLIGQREEAHRVLSEAVARGGPTIELLGRLGQAEAALGRSARAVELWERAAKLASGNRGVEVLEDLAAHFERAAQGEKARRYSARAYVASGLGALDGGRGDEAVALLERAVKADPQLARAWFALGEAQRRAGRTAEARTASERCLAIDPDHGRAMRARKLLEGK